MVWAVPRSMWPCHLLLGRQPRRLRKELGLAVRPGLLLLVVVRVPTRMVVDIESVAVVEVAVVELVPAMPTPIFAIYRMSFSDPWPGLPAITAEGSAVVGIIMAAIMPWHPTLTTCPMINYWLALVMERRIKTAAPVLDRLPLFQRRP